MNLSASELADLIFKHLQEKQTRHTEIVVRGSCTDWASYREAVGAIAACEDTAKWLREVARRSGEMGIQ
jgi:hypothetical protein